MSVELGVAYISILPSTKDLVKPLTESIKSAEGPIQNQQKSMWSRISDGMGTTLKVGAVAAGAAVAAGIGGALVKGFQRLDTIDQATAKLSGLGHSAETVEQVMGNALNSVRGTAFGMGEAATAAAGALAAGIKPGQELERNLKLVADAATIAGTDMGSMGSIFNKVAASNKVQMDVINQLHDAGVPALQLLATEMGVTAEEASKMASKGEVDFATFQAAMESGLGGAAAASGASFSGAMDNVGAALGRIGAAFMGPAFAQGAGILTSVTAALDKLAPAAAVAGEFVGGVVTEIGGGFTAMGAAFRDGNDEITSSGLAGFMEGVGVAARNVFDVMGPVFSRLGEVFAAVGPQILDLVTNFSPLSLVMQTLAPIMPLVASAFETLGTMFATILPPIVAIATTLASALVPVMTMLISSILPPLMEIIQAVAPVFAELVQAIAPVVAIIVSALMPIIQALMPIVQTVFGVIADVVTAVMGIVQGVITTVTGIISGDWGMVWEGIKQIFAGIWDTIVTVVSGAIDIVMSVISGVINAIAAVWSAVWSGISTLFSSVWNAIVSAASGFVNSVSNTFNSVMTFLQGIPDKVMGFFAGIGNWLKDSGKALIDGFISGITNAFENAKNFVSDGLSSIRDLFPFSPAKEGPFSGKGWVAYSGQAIGETFTESIVAALRKGRNGIKSELGGVQGDFASIGSGLSDQNFTSSVSNGTMNGFESGGIKLQNNTYVSPEMDPVVWARRTGRTLVNELAGVV